MSFSELSPTPLLALVSVWDNADTAAALFQIAVAAVSATSWTPLVYVFLVDLCKFETKFEKNLEVSWLHKGSIQEKRGQESRATAS
jgi:hypothetical protein